MQAAKLHLKEHNSLCVEINLDSEIPNAIEAFGLKTDQPVIVLVGGAGGIQESNWAAIHNTISVISKVADNLHTPIIDGGTDSGVMKAIGTNRATNHFNYPLIGVCARDTVTWPGRERNFLKRLRDKRAQLDPNHSHFILVPGKNWGDESIWITAVATQLAGSKPSVTILINGGQISRDQDVPNSLKAGRPVIVIEGTGRAADEFAIHPPETSLMRFFHINELELLENELQKILAT